jgi:hypothetical protein
VLYLVIHVHVSQLYFTIGSANILYNLKYLLLDITLPVSAFVVDTNEKVGVEVRAEKTEYSVYSCLISGMHEKILTRRDR